MDGDGCVLKVISVVSYVCVMLLNECQELVFFVYWFDIKIYIFDGYIVQILIDLCLWCFRGFCYFKNGDFLVSMCILDES